MRKLFLLLLVSISFGAVNAQADSLTQYTGKYKFPEGSMVSEVNVTIENGSLFAGSAAGQSELKKTADKDVFEIVAYNGLATFKRNADGKVTGVKIEVNDAVMEGTKTESIDILSRGLIVPRSR